MEVVGEKRIMKFDTKDRKFQIDGATGKRLYKKGGKRTTTPEHNMLVNDLDINIPIKVSRNSKYINGIRSVVGR